MFLAGRIATFFLPMLAILSIALSSASAQSAPTDGSVRGLAETVQRQLLLEGVSLERLQETLYLEELESGGHLVSLKSEAGEVRRRFLDSLSADRDEAVAELVVIVSQLLEGSTAEAPPPNPPPPTKEIVSPPPVALPSTLSVNVPAPRYDVFDKVAMALLALKLSFGTAHWYGGLDGAHWFALSQAASVGLAGGGVILMLKGEQTSIVDREFVHKKDARHPVGVTMAIAGGVGFFVAYVWQIVEVVAAIGPETRTKPTTNSGLSVGVMESNGEKGWTLGYHARF